MSKPIANSQKPAAISFAIGIPTLNRWDLLKPSLQMYVQDFPDTHITVIDNGHQAIDFDHEDVGYIVPAHNLGVAASWNLICKRAFAYHPTTHVIILNDDIYLGLPQRPQEGHANRQEELKSIVQKYPRDFYKSLHDDWCVFIMPRHTWQLIGEFDERFFPAYFEDRDYRYRMRIAGLSCMEAVMFNPFVHRNSATSDRDRSVLNNFEKNKQLYIDKWGGKPGHEKYRTPFNKK